MDDIAKELGMSKKTIYQFYKEKDDIVNQLCELEMIQHEKEMIELFEQSKDPVHEIMLISKKMREMMQKINPMFFMDLHIWIARGFHGPPPIPPTPLKFPSKLWPGK